MKTWVGLIFNPIDSTRCNMINLLEGKVVFHFLRVSLTLEKTYKSTPNTQNLINKSSEALFVLLCHVINISLELTASMQIIRQMQVLQLIGMQIHRAWLTRGVSMAFPRGRELFNWAGPTKERNNILIDISREYSLHKPCK